MRLWRGRDRDDLDESAAVEADVERAYERGRQDERRRHRSHPVLASLMFLAAVVGVGAIYLAAREGSFTHAGQVVDHKLASATGSAAAETALNR
jgi:hypothetical protein